MNYITVDSDCKEFENTIYNPDLIVVQKESIGFSEYTQFVYVFERSEKSEQNTPSYAIIKHITPTGTSYWKEIYDK